MTAIKIHSCTSALQALYRVFVLPAFQPAIPLRPHLHHKTRRLAVPTHPATYSPRRAFTQSTTRHSKTREPEKRTQKWNEEITAPFIMLVDPSTNQLPRDPVTLEIISKPERRWDILRRLDLKTHRLVQLTPDEPENPDFIPVCKIVSKKEIFDADKKSRESSRKRKAESLKTNSVKTLELNWAIDANDLGHRLERVQEFLAEGRRVEIILAAKKRGRKADKGECEGLLGKILGVLEQVEGAKVLKELEGKVGGFATLVLQGRAEKEVGVKG